MMCCARCFDEHVRGHEVVLSALGNKRAIRRIWERACLAAGFFRAHGGDARERDAAARLARVIAVSAAGVADSAARMNLLMKLLVAKSNIGIAYRDLAAMERVRSRNLIGAARARRALPGPLTDA